MISSSNSLRASLAAGGLLLAAAPLFAAAPAGKPATRTARPAAARPNPSSARPAAATSGAMTAEQVVRAFLEAQKNGDDAKAYALLSSASKQRTTQKQWADRAHQVRSTFSAITLVAGDALLIGGGPVAQQQVNAPVVKGDRATVQFTQMLPVRNTLHLVKENGRWVIEIQRSLVGGDTGQQTAAQTPTPAPTPTPTTPSTPPPPDFSNQCRANLRQAGNALRVYALDHDGRLPDASKWTDELMPYLQSPTALKCPPDSPADSNFAMNSALSGQRLVEIQNPGERILLYQTTTTGRNVNGTGSTLPAKPNLTSGFLVLLANGNVEFRTERPTIR